MDAQIDSDPRTRPPAAPTVARQPAPREALDREEQLIRDAVLRMGALVEAAIREASPGARRRTTRRSPWTSSRATRSSTRRSAGSRA